MHPLQLHNDLKIAIRKIKNNMMKSTIFEIFRQLNSQKNSEQKFLSQKYLIIILVFDSLSQKRLLVLKRS
jgi:hypothetical protein